MRYIKRNCETCFHDESRSGEKPKNNTCENWVIKDLSLGDRILIDLKWQKNLPKTIDGRWAVVVEVKSTGNARIKLDGQSSIRTIRRSQIADKDTSAGRQTAKKIIEFINERGSREYRDFLQQMHRADRVTQQRFTELCRQWFLLLSTNRAMKGTHDISCEFAQMLAPLIEGESLEVKTDVDK